MEMYAIKTQHSDGSWHYLQLPCHSVDDLTKATTFYNKDVAKQNLKSLPKDVVAKIFQLSIEEKELVEEEREFENYVEDCVMQANGEGPYAEEE